MSFQSPAFLRQQASALLDFYLPVAINPDGGYFTQIDDDGTVYDRQSEDLVNTCRYLHNFALATQLQIIDGKDVIVHGLQRLRSAFHDKSHGGYLWSLHSSKPRDRRKLAYGHAFVLLAAATAMDAGVDATDVLDEADRVLEAHFWDPVAGLYRDEISHDWATIEPYRGQNANMHLVEALLAAYQATAIEHFLDRAEHVAQRVIVDLRSTTAGLLWEHYDEHWRADLEFNRATPRDLYRPYGVLPGHLLEWAKLLALLDRARTLPWALVAAEELFAQAVQLGWDVSRGGFRYAIDLDGTVVDGSRYAWVIAEAIGAAATLGGATEKPDYTEWLERFWDFAWRNQIDRDCGGWYPALTAEHERLHLPFTRGKSDFYHPLSAIALALQSDAQQGGTK
jgi:mannose/cellobiose epimerase-like protein (N-acyl-D-glucosamine 2-epimerase family)